MWKCHDSLSMSGSFLGCSASIPKTSPKTLSPKTLNPKTLNPKTLNPRTLNLKTLNPSLARTAKPRSEDRWCGWMFKAGSGAVRTQCVLTPSTMMKLQPDGGDGGGGGDDDDDILG